MLRRLLLLFLIIFQLGLQAQQFNEKQVQLIDGKTYYLHKVEKGNTLYSLSKMYSIKVKDLLAENPQLEEGLKIGQVIRIPVKKVDSKLTGGNAPEVAGDSLIHEVKAKETLYALSKRYNISVEEIQKNNPQVAQGLKIGMKLYIPQPKTIDKGEPEILLQPAEEDSFVLHLVEPKQTLYSLAIEYDLNIDSIRLINDGLKEGLKVGTTIRIPILKAEEGKISNPENVGADSGVTSTFILDTTELKNRYKLSLLLPFYLDSNDSLNTTRLEFQKSEIYGKSEIALEFYTGFKMALDSFRSDSVGIDVNVFDVSLNPNYVSTSDFDKLLENPDFLTSDLIVGPFHRSNFLKASEFALENRIPIVSPVPLRGDYLKTNPYAIKVHTSEKEQVEFIRDYAIQNWTEHNLVLVENNEMKDLVLAEHFQGINGTDTNQVFYDSINGIFKKVKLYEFDTARLNRVLIDSVQNILVLPIRSKTFVGQFLAGLNRYAQDYNIKVVGLDSWNRMGYLEYRFLNNLRVHTVHNQFVDYTDTLTQHFILVYRNTFMTEPSKWAFLGYDMGTYFMNALATYGTAFQNDFDRFPFRGLSKSFNFKRVTNTGGFENQQLRLIGIENYQYKEVE